VLYTIISLVGSGTHPIVQMIKTRPSMNRGQESGLPHQGPPICAQVNYCRDLPSGTVIYFNLRDVIIGACIRVPSPVAKVSLRKEDNSIFLMGDTG
jgi:hypothetical protein